LFTTSRSGCFAGKESAVIAASNAPIQAVERARLAEQVAKRLEMAIREGRLLPGERLPSERALSEQFAVSRPVLREGLQVLLERSLIITRAGQGTFVRDLSAELAKSPPEEWFQEHRTQVREFYEARLVIEPECAALAADRASESQRAELMEIIDSSERAVADGQPIVFTGLDIDFHKRIAEMSANRLLRQMLAAIIHPDTDLRRVLHGVPGHLTMAQSRHSRIARAIDQRLPSEARRAMIEALEGTLADIDRLLAERRRG
jgi:GntR family transcriptional repressor for pyruvate dehydrogenase complex